MYKRQVDGKTLTIYAKANAAERPWGESGVDVALECTGFYTSKAKSQAHIDAGAKMCIRDRYMITCGYWDYFEYGCDYLKKYDSDFINPCLLYTSRIGVISHK